MKRLFLGLAVLSLLACGKNINNKEAVKAAIVKRVQKTGFDVNSMQVDVTNVSFHDQDAVATVSFVPKGGAAQNAVTFKYNLHREKDEWVATGLAQGGMQSSGGQPNPHGGLPPATASPMAPGPADPSRPLPAGHPPIGSQK